MNNNGFTRRDFIALTATSALSASMSPALTNAGGVSKGKDSKKKSTKKQSTKKKSK